MAFPCKDELAYFEKLAQKQYRIFRGSAEFGLPCSELDMVEVRQNLLKMMDVFRQDPEFYEYETRVEGDDQAGLREVAFFVPVDTDAGVYKGVRLTIGRYWGSRSGVGPRSDYEYITIGIQDHRKA